MANVQIDKITSLADIIAIEQIPYEQTVSIKSTYEIFQSAAQQYPANDAIIYLPTGSLSETPVILNHSELFARITQTANMLYDLGIGPNDTVSYLLPNLPQTQYILWGAQAAGIVNPINFLLQSDQISDLLNAVETKVLIALGPHPDIDIWDKVMDIKDKVTNLKAIIRVSNNTSEPMESIYDFDDLIKKSPGDHLKSNREIQRTDIAAYYHTGGTTGAPKIVKLTHGNQVHSAWSAAQLLGMTSKDIMNNGMPLFHVGGTISCSLSPFSAGGAIIMLSPAGMRNPLIIENYWKLVEKYHATIIGGVPTALAALTNVPLGDVNISKVRLTVSGAAPLPKAVLNNFEKISNTKIYQILGMTETAGVTSIDPVHRKRHAGSAGIRLPYENIKTVHIQPDGSMSKDCAPSETGALLVKGPNVFTGYKNKIHNKDIFTEDGWYISGDLAKIDEDGNIYIIGREKDVIIRGGHNIDPALIEEIIERHPAVQMSAAIGQPDSYAGEVPIAYVTLHSGATASDNEILSFVEDHIFERPARPRHIFVVDALPMTGVGKVFKPDLRCDATRRIIEQTLFPLKSAEATIDVQIDQNSGIVAILNISKYSNISALEAEVSEKLDGFLFTYKLKYD